MPTSFPSSLDEEPFERLPSKCQQCPQQFRVGPNIPDQIQGWFQHIRSSPSRKGACTEASPVEGICDGEFEGPRKGSVPRHHCLLHHWRKWNDRASNRMVLD